AEVERGSALNHTSPPPWSRIIGPASPGPEYGATNSSPGATAGEEAVTDTTGGCRAGRGWKLWTSAALPGWIASGVVVRGSSSAIPNWSRIGWDEPPLRGRARTLTRSPSENGLAGTKLAPSPWE